MKSIKSLFKSRPTIHHFRINFPLNPARVSSCLSQLQQLTPQNTQAIFLTLNGFGISPQIMQTLHNGFHHVSTKSNIPVFTFLEEYATSMTYFLATCGNISANPYCIIGDVGLAQKSYFNIHKLMNFFNIKIDLLGLNKETPSQSQKQLTQEWLSVVQQNMLQTISKRRNLPIQTLKGLHNKLLTPQQALSHKLIDSITTLQQFNQLNFPQVKIVNHIYSVTDKMPSLKGRQISILMGLQEKLQMDQVGLMMMGGILDDAVNDVVELIKGRTQTTQDLQQLDSMLGIMFNHIQTKLSMQDNHLII